MECHRDGLANFQGRRGEGGSCSGRGNVLRSRVEHGCRGRDCRESRGKVSWSTEEAETKWLTLVTSRLSKLAKSSLEPTTFRFVVAFSRKIKFPVETTPACERASLHHRI